MKFSLPVIAIAVATRPQVVASSGRGASYVGRAAVREARKLRIAGAGAGGGTGDPGAVDVARARADATSSVASLLCAARVDDAGDPALECHLEGEVCEEHEGEQYCATGTSLRTKAALDLTGITKIESTQCNNFTRPQHMADIGRLCFTVDVEVDSGGLIAGTLFGTLLDALAGEEEAAEVPEPNAVNFLDDFFLITGCSSSFDNGTITDCDCGICEDGVSFKLTCPNNLVSEECTDFEGATHFVEGGFENPAESVAVLRLIELPTADGAAVASDAGGEAAAGGGAPAPDAAPADAAGANYGASDASAAISVATDVVNPEGDSADEGASDPDAVNTDASDASSDASSDLANDPVFDATAGALADTASPAARRHGAAAAGLAAALVTGAALL